MREATQFRAIQGCDWLFCRVPRAIALGLGRRALGLMKFAGKGAGALRNWPQLATNCGCSSTKQNGFS